VYHVSSFSELRQQRTVAGLSRCCSLLILRRHDEKGSEQGVQFNGQVLGMTLAAETCQQSGEEIRNHDIRNSTRYRPCGRR